MEHDDPSERKTKATDMKDLIRVFEKGLAKSAGRHVLIVDDEPTIRRMVSRSMTTLDRDVVVHEAEHGRHALDTLNDLRQNSKIEPILIVTDLQMPVMDGWEFIDQLWKDCQSKGRTEGIPVIVLSASSGEKGWFGGKSVHGEKCKYSPLVAIAKEDCIKPQKYDTQGEKGLMTWLKHFLH